MAAYKHLNAVCWFRNWIGRSCPKTGGAGYRTCVAGRGGASAARPSASRPSHASRACRSDRRSRSRRRRDDGRPGSGTTRRRGTAPSDDSRSASYSPGMTVKCLQISVGPQPMALTTSDADGESVAIQNLGTENIFVGDDWVTPTTGFQIATGQVLTVDLGGGEILFACAAVAGQKVHVLRTRV